MFLRSAIVAFAIALALPAFAAGQQKAETDDQEKHLDIRSSKGDLHVGNDADARKAGFPLYPGARLKHNDDGRDSVNFGILSETFGVKFVIANYDSEDAPGKIIEYYRGKLAKYGKVLECHSHEHGGNVDPDINDDHDHPAKELKCESDNTGPVTELKVGTENNQHLVAVEPRGAGGGSTFALVYVHLRKEGEI
jgi:hypothetical protein